MKSSGLYFSNLHTPQHCGLTVVNVELGHSSPTEVGSFLHINQTMLALFPLNVLLHPKSSLVHQVPAPDAAV